MSPGVGAMSYRYLPLDSLAINRGNDRHGELENETAAIAWLFNNFELHMRNLAKDIDRSSETLPAQAPRLAARRLPQPQQ